MSSNHPLDWHGDHFAAECMEIGPDVSEDWGVPHDSRPLPMTDIERLERDRAECHRLHKEAEAENERLQAGWDAETAVLKKSEAENERLRAAREDQRQLIQAYDRTASELRAENERLRVQIREDIEQAKAKLHEEFDRLLDGHEAENERLRAVVEAAQAFVHQHQIGQPGTPGTLYPMTYGVQDQWHEEWDRRLAALIAASQR